MMIAVGVTNIGIGNPVNTENLLILKSGAGWVKTVKHFEIFYRK